MKRTFIELLAIGTGICGMACWGGPASAATPQTVAIVDARALSTDERLTAVCLQGLLNREGAHFFLNFGGGVDTTKLRNDLGPTGPLWGAASFAALTE